MPLCKITLLNFDFALAKFKLNNLFNVFPCHKKISICIFFLKNIFK